MALLEVRGLEKWYGRRQVVNGVEFDVNRGEVVGLLGPNGAGKTTTIEILEGLLEPSGGEVEVLGRHWGGRDDEEIRQRVGISLQETRLSEKLTVPRRSRYSAASTSAG